MLMSITNEAEVQFVSRRKLDAVHSQDDSASDAPAAVAVATKFGFQAHYSFLSGLQDWDQR